MSRAARFLPQVGNSTRQAVSLEILSSIFSLEWSKRGNLVGAVDKIPAGWNGVL